MDSQWVFEYMCQVLQAPTWEVPVMSFIDETCCIFDNEEENKLAHTDAHVEFKELVENLLLQHLTEVGISSDDFYEACEVAYKSGDATDFAKRIVEQLIACDDFMTFKAIMVKRNKELEMEALMSLDGEDIYDSDGEEIDFDLRAARKLSERESKEFDDMERQETADIECALQLSEETERLKEVTMLEKEQADLEAAIAMSLAVEEERLRNMEQNCGEGESKSASESKSTSESKSSSVLGNLPSLGVSANEQRRALEDTRMAAQQVMSGSLNPMGSTEGYDEVDIARRKKHLEAQRKRILERKKKEREEELRKYQRNKKADKTAPIPASEQEEAPRKMSSQQQNLTFALARRMKQDMVIDSTNDTFSSLDAKLKQVEMLRQERANLMRG